MRKNKRKKEEKLLQSKANEKTILNWKKKGRKSIATNC